MLQTPSRLLRRAAAATWSSALVAVLLTVAAPSRADPVFHATQLALPSGMTDSRVWGINAGVIVGESSAGSGPRATVWSGAASPTLLISTFASSAYAVNSTGRIAGFRESNSPATNTEASQWSASGAAPSTIGAPSGASVARAAVASLTAGALADGAFVHDGSSTTMLGTAGSIAYGLRGDGVAVGQDANGAAVVFNGANAGTLADLGTAWAILGDQVVGSHDDLGGLQHAFLVTLGGAMVNLFGGAAFDLNSSGSVVGADFDAGVAMLFDGTLAYNLNTLVADGLDGFMLTQARGIDDDGTIVAFGINAAGLERSFVLRLGDAGGGGGGGIVSEPGSLALALIALAMLSAGLVARGPRRGVAQLAA
jgi:hypothetical protein